MLAVQCKIVVRAGWRAKPGIRGKQFSDGRQHGVRRCIGRELCAVHVCARVGRSHRRRGGYVAVASSLLNSGPTPQILSGSRMGPISQYG